MDDAAKAQAERERWYGRLKRAFNRLEKARRNLARLRRRIDAHESAANAPRTAPAKKAADAGGIDLAALAAETDDRTAP
jgi:hypothetical protein